MTIGRSSEELNVATRTFQEVIRNVETAIYWTDTDGTIEYVNPAFEAQTGYAAAEAIGRTPRMFNSGVHDEEFYTDLWETILNGEVWNGELVNERKDGELYIVKQTISPITDESGDLVRFVAINEDITDLRAYEEELEAQRDDLEILNRVIRHDIRNDLQVVTGYANLAEEYIDEDGQHLLDPIQRSASHAVELTDNMRDLVSMSLQSNGEPGEVALEPLLDAQVDDLRSDSPEVAVTVDGSIPDTDVVGDDLLESVFRNLLRNVVQHTDKETPVVTVTATRQEDVVEIRITDNGPGIPDSRKETIFGKGESGLDSEGTGVGLYLVQAVVDRYGGDVWVEDNEPVGAIFVVQLPVAR